MVISYIIHVYLEAAPRLARSLRPTTAWNYRATRACALTHTHIHTYTRISDVYLRIDLLYTDILVVTLIVITNYMVCIT